MGIFNGSINDSAMAKVHSIIGIIATTFVIILLFILLVGIDFDGGDFNKIIAANKGLIWGISSIIGSSLVGLGWILSAQTARDKQQKDRENELLSIISEKKTEIKEQNGTIKTQNEEVIKILKESALRQIEIGEKLNQNTENDLKTKEQISNFESRIDRIFELLESKEKSFIKEIAKIKTWMTNHEKKHHEKH